MERVTVSISGLDPALQQTRIVQLSDFHYDGYRLSSSLLEEAIAQANAAQPDLLVLTGDFITSEPYPILTLAQKLTTLQSRRGICAVLGNHDHRYPKARKQVTHALEEIGIQVLWNQQAEPLGPNLPIVGLADFWSKQFDPASVLDQIDPQTPRIVLSHNPDSLTVLKPWRVDLQLSGHTHGGQVVLPGLGPAQRWLPDIDWCFPDTIREFLSSKKGKKTKKKPKRHPTLKHWDWSQGLHRVDDSWLYVNRGLGTYWPGRLFCPPEVTVIELVGA
ncbi:metallophosphoesterase [Leptolyngbya sp. NM3-A1]